MKNTLVLALLAATVGFGAAARTLTPAEALRRAEMQNGNVMRTMTLDNRQVSPVITTSTAQGAALYVFDNGGSYAVVAADDCAPALLGYGDAGTAINNDAMPPALRYWLDQYTAQINYAQQHNAPAYMPRNAAEDFAPIQPMTLTRWNQDAPYNNDCPVINGQRCVTGCVATALAQVMKYHNYPPKGTGEASYALGSQTISFNYDTTFDWDNMLDVYTSSATDAQDAAVAKLMFACGVGVSMDYTPQESGSNPMAVPELMVKHFGYDKGIRYLSRDYYGATEWNKAVYDNLVQYGPCQYSGQSDQGGHSFVCDGYSQDGYFHINWGWGGMSDGYFLLSALDPESQGIGGSTSGYNFDQSIIANVKNGDNGVATGTLYEQVLAEEAFQPSAAQVQLGSQMAFGGGFYNLSAGEISGALGLKLVDQAGNVSYIAGTQFSDLPVQSGYRAFYVTLPEDLDQGQYTVSPAFLNSQGTWQDIPVKKSEMQNLLMTVDNGTASFAAGETPSVSVTNVTLTTPIYVGADYKVTATVTNNSAAEYYGAIALMLVNSDSQGVAIGANYTIDLEPGQSQEIEYISAFNPQNGGTIEAGDYYICFVGSNDYSQLSDMQPVTVSAKPAQTTVRTTAPAIEEASSVDPENFKVSSTVSCTEGYFGGSLMLVVFPYEEGQSVSSVATYSTDNLFLNAGDQQTVNVNTRFLNAQPGKRYFCAFYNGQQPVSDNYGYFTVKSTTGCDDLQKSNPVVATTYFTLQGIEVDNSNLSSGLYIVVYTRADGQSTTTRRLIR